MIALVTATALQAAVLASDLSIKLRPVRVLIVEEVDKVRFRADSTITIRTADGEKRAEKEITFTNAGNRIRLGTDLLSSETVELSAKGTPIWISTHSDGRWLPELEYPGEFQIIAGDDGLDVINLVDVEQYVACVVANEVWPTFHEEAYRGQAIVSRTFVLYQMTRRGQKRNDVTANQYSQVYRGLRHDEVGRKAAEAAEYTRGIVLTYPDGDRQRLFCTYFSAACGGESQPASFLGPHSNVPPLQGGVKCDDCKIAPGETYRWGPVRLSKEEVFSRLVARYPDLKSLRRIENITVDQRTPFGRPVVLRIEGADGKSHEILAERFRLAIDGNLIRSTDCRIRVEGDEIIFDQGRGFGHGLGLCQWGMEGKARKGEKAGEILLYYYPGATLSRAY